MGGGLMQLVAYGAQDIYLTGNPQITFFKVVYRRHTNFSMECIKQSFKGTVGNNARVVATLARNGDLVHDCFLKVKGDSVGFNDAESQVMMNPGHNILDYIECEIGGQLIDKHYGHWMEAHAELTDSSDDLGYLHTKTQDIIFGQAVASINFANFPKFQTMAGAGGVGFTSDDGGGAPLKNIRLYVPLRFWFSRHVGLSLPLIALQYHEVNINVKFTGLLRTLIGSGGNVELWCNYIYLDTDERRRFAQVSHEYLIEQVQFQSFSMSDSQTSATFKLNFNHPVKELIWGGIDLSLWGQIGDGTQGVFRVNNNGALIQYQVKLNGHDRFEMQDAEYFTRYQTYKYHTGFGRGNKTDVLNVYSFALKPEEHQPSGTCNFSRIDNAELLCKLPGAAMGDSMAIYAVNYNVLRIMSGMGGLAYSN